VWRRILFHLNYLYTHGDGESENVHWHLYTSFFGRVINYTATCSRFCFLTTQVCNYRLGTALTLTTDVKHGLKIVFVKSQRMSLRSVLVCCQILKSLCCSLGCLAQYTVRSVLTTACNVVFRRAKHFSCAPCADYSSVCSTATDLYEFWNWSVYCKGRANWFWWCGCDQEDNLD
jgi:hypothetical protein